MDKTWIPTVVGVLEFIAAVCAVAGALALGFAGAVINTVPDLQQDPEVPLELLTALLGTLAVLVFLGGLVCLIGGLAAINRRRWAWALAGAIAALFLATPAGILALVLVIVGEKEFGDRAEPSPLPEK